MLPQQYKANPTLLLINAKQYCISVRKEKKNEKKGGNKETKGFKWVATCHDATEDMILRELS